MLISRRNGELFLVDQIEHARLSGDLVARWGNERFAAPVRRESARLAAAMHDEGWREADEEPLFNAAEGRPLHFLEIDTDAHVPLYGRGVDRVFARDPYAGLLVSMHWTGLYRSRWGLQAARVAFAGKEVQDEAVAREELRWIAVKQELASDMRRSDLELGLWHNYDLLQAWDLLSLYVCVLDYTPAPRVEAVPVQSTLKGLVQTPGDRTVEAVPTTIGGERVDLTLSAVEPGVVRVDPWPFDADELTCEVAAKVVADRRYDDAADAKAALDDARVATISCRMIRG